ncbi:KdsC family phosphatase [Rhizobium sp. RAF36]|uniref:KdsC family phosphatase n=1 Tax=Rhizobium sp. RAF36 TaxID=3233055 RepID=UPI0013AF1DEB
MPNVLTPDPALAGVKLLTCDVDGVLTDGGMYFGPDGLSLLRFHVQDGTGLKLLMSEGVEVCFISQSQNPIITRRASVLGIRHCCLGVDNKLAPIVDLVGQLGIDLREVCHIADDVNDMSLLEKVGFPITVPAGVDRVKAVCRYETKAAGGHGAVRELCEAILAARRLG